MDVARRYVLYFSGKASGLSLKALFQQAFVNPVGAVRARKACADADSCIELVAVRTSSLISHPSMADARLNCENPDIRRACTPDALGREISYFPSDTRLLTLKCRKGRW
jgi:hypothetical protein